MSTKVLGAYTGVTSTTAKHDLGSEYTDRNGTKWVYVKADTNAKTAYSVCYIASDYTLGDGVGASAVGDCGVPQVAFAASEYGWVAIKGPMTVKYAAGVAAGAAIYTSATAGALDDAASSQLKIHGLTVNATQSGSGNHASYAGSEIYCG